MTAVEQARERPKVFASSELNAVLYSPLARAAVVRVGGQGEISKEARAECSLDRLAAVAARPRDGADGVFLLES